MERISYESGFDEDDYVAKCMRCRHSYTTQDESDTLFCSCVNGCDFESAERTKSRKER